MRTMAILLVGLALAGCETMNAVKERPIEFAVSDFCLNAVKQPWSIDDDLRTIKAARQHNAKIDRLCSHGEKVTS